MNRRRRQGFTLVEVMIVLAILVLLVAMVGPRLLKQQDKADKQLTVQQIDSIEKALQFYKVDNRSYPSTEEGLVALLKKPSDENRARNWDGPYLDESQVPVDAWGKKFAYAYPPKFGNDKPNIWSHGPDGKENTADDITNWPAGSKPSEGGEFDEADSFGDELIDTTAADDLAQQ